MILLKPAPRKVRAFLCCVLLACGAAALPASARTSAEVVVGQPLRDAPMHGLNAPDRKLSAYRGKALLINVWASWCGPCRMEMGTLERLAWLESSKKFTIIGVSTDDSEAAAKAYLARSNATLNHYLDHALELENMLGANRLPLTVLVAPNGTVVGKFYGAREWDSAEAQAWIHARLK